MAAAPHALIIGGDGTIGRALGEALRARGWIVTATTTRAQQAGSDRPYLDLARGPADGPGLPKEVSVAFLCAAVTALARCEADPAGTQQVNVTATIAWARHLASCGAHVLFPSTNLVFDGSRPHVPAEAPRSPRTEYGRQKATAEEALAGLGDAVTIVRLTKVMPPDWPLLVDWRDRLCAGKMIEAFEDKTFSPVPLAFTIEAMIRVAERQLGGLLQISGPADVRYVDAARDLARACNVAPDRVRPVASGAPTGASPAFTTLDLTRLRTELGMEPPFFADVLAPLIQET